MVFMKRHATPTPVDRGTVTATTATAAVLCCSSVKLASWQGCQASLTLPLFSVGAPAKRGIKGMCWPRMNLARSPEILKRPHSMPRRTTLPKEWVQLALRAKNADIPIFQKARKTRCRQLRVVGQSLIYKVYILSKYWRSPSKKRMALCRS
ncbi:hypothetical protein F4780DRAFT_393981 [Xylariomycetidae sp. FL0641]|nr:hypothetical protein F4780DRAFT_393981 [Xylariomycetidae sp. FL0641]